MLLRENSVRFLILVVIDASVEIFFTGFIAKDPNGEEIIGPKDGVFVYTKNDKEAIKKKITVMKKKFAKIEKHQFSSSIKVPKKFAPTVIGNVSKGFAGLTLTKMLKKVQIAEKKAARASASASPGPVSQAGSNKFRRSRGLAEADGA